MFWIGNSEGGSLPHTHSGNRPQNEMSMDDMMMHHHEINSINQHPIAFRRVLITAAATTITARTKRRLHRFAKICEFNSINRTVNRHYDQFIYLCTYRQAAIQHQGSANSAAATKSALANTHTMRLYGNPIEADTQNGESRLNKLRPFHFRILNARECLAPFRILLFGDFKRQQRVTMRGVVVVAVVPSHECET